MPIFSDKNIISIEREKRFNLIRLTKLLPVETSSELKDKQGRILIEVLGVD